jgi:hypothetical protein
VVVDHRLAASCACLPQAGWAGAEPYLTRASVCLTLPWELCDKTLPNSAAATNAISQSVPDTTLPLFYCVGAWLRWQAAIRSACLCAVYHRLQRDTCSPFWAHIVTIHHICTWFLADCKAAFPETYMPVANRAANNLCSPGVFARAVKPCRRALRFHAPSYMFLLRKIWRGCSGVKTSHPTQGLVVFKCGLTAAIAFCCPAGLLGTALALRRVRGRRRMQRDYTGLQNYSESVSRTKPEVIS